VGRDDQPLRVDPAAGEVAIAEDGTVRQGKQVRGQLALRAFAKPESLPRAGALRFDATGAEAAPLKGGLSAGALEQSTVDPAAAMVEMIRLNRLYELSLKVASTLTNDLDARALSDVASTR
jgi:flagellar basal body rod protein FlgG